MPNTHERLTFAQQLAQILAKNKTISEKEAHALQESFAQSAIENFEDFLIEEGLVEESDLLNALSQYYKVPAFDANGYFFETMLLQQFPKDFLLRNGVIPLEMDENMLIVVAARPFMDGLESAMQQFASYPVEYMVGIKRDINNAVSMYYDRSLTQDVEQEDMSQDEQTRLEREAIEADEEIEEITYGDVIYRDEEDRSK